MTNALLLRNPQSRFPFQKSKTDRKIRTLPPNAARQTPGSRKTTSGKKRRAVQERLKRRDGKNGSQFYFNFTGFPFPLGPVFKRHTVRREIEQGRVWLFEQEHTLAFSNVVTNIRMTIIRLKSGGLWVHAPIAPTEECVRLILELGYQVEYIILPTFAYEHKIFVGPFSRKFPNADVFTAPRLWSWPLPLPPQAFGIFTKGTLQDDDERTPWAAEIKQKVFSSSVGFGPYTEVAFFDVSSRSLIVTDAVIQVPSTPPEVIPEKALKNSGRRVPFPISAVCKGDNQLTPPAPEDEAQIKSLGHLPEMLKSMNSAGLAGWMRMALLILYFVPYDLLTPQKSFGAVADKLFVSPVVRTLVFTKASRDEVRAWVGSICKDWKFDKIIPAHFDAPISANAADLRKAFTFLYEGSKDAGITKPTGLLSGFFRKAGQTGRVLTEFPYNDMRGLRALESSLQKSNVINKP